MLALEGIKDVLHIEIKSHIFMDRFVIQTCNNCGKEFHEWSCDYCYTKIIINQVEGLLCNK